MKIRQHSVSSVTLMVTILRATYEAVQESAEEGFHGPENPEAYCLTDEERAAVLSATVTALRALSCFEESDRPEIEAELDRLIVERAERAADRVVIGPPVLDGDFDPPTDH